MADNSISIRLLPPELRNQIAAGEVVERPASVVKELIENSIDAGASQIDVRLDNGGQSLIRVRDDGAGIPPEELELAVARHATSKIRDLRDLENISTYGFRGEALASVASVSRFRIVSITKDAAEPGVAHSLDVEYGLKPVFGRASLTRGALIEARDLFANIPVRLKFLKSPASEFKRAQAWLSRLALAHPEIGFSLAAGERQAARFVRGQSLAARLRQIWPGELVDEMVPIDAEIHGVRLSGLAAPPQLHQPRADRMFFYVNGRAISDKRLLGAAREAYKGRLIGRDYPQIVLFININPAEVDVNAHPAKTEVRFRNEAPLFSAIFGALGDAFAQKSFFAPPAPDGFWGSIDRPPLVAAKPPGREPGEWTAYVRETRRPETPDDKYEESRQTAETPSLAAEETALFDAPFSPLKERVEFAAVPAEPREFDYLGQIADTYLVLRDHNGDLVILDQHAAHERVIYSRLKSGALRGESRPLMIPIELHSPDPARFAKTRPQLENFGFRFRVDGSSLAVDAVPPLLEAGDARDLLREILLGVKDDADAIFASVACKAAVKAGQKLCADEALGLARQWLAAPQSEFCPHGRPCVLRWDSQALERLFKRR